MKTTLAALLGMVACTSAAAVSKEDQATMNKTKILTGMNSTGVEKGCGYECEGCCYSCSNVNCNTPECGGYC